MSGIGGRTRAWATRFAVLAVALAALLALGADPAPADGIGCGAVVTTSIELDGDLVGCTGDGIVAGADGIVIDLKGHTIAGAPGSQAGVRVAFRHDVTVTNGTVEGFVAGVTVDTSVGTSVWNVTARGNVRGIDLGSAVHSLIEKNELLDNGLDGVRLGLSRDNVVRHNLASGNVWGISVADTSTGNLVTQNRSVGNVHGMPIFSSSSGNTISRNLVAWNVYYGIAFQSGSDENLASQNTVTGNGTDGILVQSDVAGPVAVLQNTATANGHDGIHVDSEQATVTKNTADANGNLGIFAVPGVTDGGGNEASGNGDPAECIGVICAAD